jgi:hypothetical protein
VKQAADAVHPIVCFIYPAFSSSWKKELLPKLFTQLFNAMALAC